MATTVYIDGFNLYYGALRDTPYKWLDLEALCRRLLPKDNINKIRYLNHPGFDAHFHDWKGGIYAKEVRQGDEGEGDPSGW
jgi:hypothetical protein